MSAPAPDDPRPVIGDLIKWLMFAGCAWQIGQMANYRRALDEAEKQLGALKANAAPVPKRRRRKRPNVVI